LRKTSETASRHHLSTFCRIHEELRWGELEWEGLEWEEMGWKELEWKELEWEELEWEELHLGQLEWEELLFCTKRQKLKENTKFKE